MRVSNPSSSPYNSNNTRPRVGIFDRQSIVSASTLRSNSMPATRNPNNNATTSSGNVSAPYRGASSTLVRAGSAAATRRPPGATSTTTTSNSAMGRPNSTSNNNNNNNNTASIFPSPGTASNNFMSHTVSRGSQRSRLLQHSNSPQQQQQQHLSSAVQTPVSKTVASMPSLDTPINNLRASPTTGNSSRGLFSPLSSSSYSPLAGDNGSSVGSPSPARSEYSLPSTSATPINALSTPTKNTTSTATPNHNSSSSAQRGGLVYSSTFDYGSTTNRFGLPASSPTTSTAAKSLRTGGGQQQHHHHHHNHNSLLPPLQRKAQGVLTETTNLLAKQQVQQQQQQQQQQRNMISNNGFARSPSNDELGIELAQGDSNSGGIHFPAAHHTIVFDLDETLCCNRGPGRAILRPGAVDLLRDLAAQRDQLRRSSSSSNGQTKDLEIVLWTASMEDVAVPVVRRLDPDGTFFDHLIYRDHRWFKNESNYTKDLKVLGRDMAGCCIIENSPVSVRLNRQHAILVKDFMGMSYRDVDLFSVRDVLLQWINGDSFVPIDRYLATHPQMCSRSNSIKASTSMGPSSGARFF